MRSDVALRNLYALVDAVFYFISVVIGASAKLNLIFKRVCEKARRFYEVAASFQSSIAAGIERLLFAFRASLHETDASSDSGHLRLTVAVPPSWPAVGKLRARRA